ncbi:MAG: TolC family protein [Planctomycetales bacterium]|nr:TolC family protein [Planctomycetales bacterium]
MPVTLPPCRIWIVAIALVYPSLGGCALRGEKPSPTTSPTPPTPPTPTSSATSPAAAIHSVAVTPGGRADTSPPAVVAAVDAVDGVATERASVDGAASEPYAPQLHLGELRLTSVATTDDSPAATTTGALPLEEVPAIGAQDVVEVRDVVASIHATFPLLAAASQEAVIAAGKQTAAWGGFDTKLKGASENGPLGFYETYRHSAGVENPLYGGGSVFGGYRVGRGSFQPWYQERQTNDGGELKAGLRVPLLRDRQIDARRAELWRATYDRQRAQPEIRAQLIQFVRDGSIAYWYWVAAGRQVQIGERALRLAQQRNQQLQRKVEAGDVAPPELQDSLRAIAKREAKLIDLRRKREQASVKLSLFLRDDSGVPWAPSIERLPAFPEPAAMPEQADDVAQALAARPEIAALDAAARAVNVDLAESRNDLLPALDAQVIGSQDLGEPTSKKRDKSEFELEAGLYVDMPVQRRKARGKAQAARGKLAQISAKRRFTADKIATEVQATHIALDAAFQRIGRARESQRLAEYMASVERRKFELGDSNLLSVALREQYAVEAADAEVEALFEYFAALADFHAAMGRDWP